VSRRLAFFLFAAVATSCGSTEQELPHVQNLDRPVDVAIACHGQMRVTGGDGAQAEDPLVFSPMPLEACRIRTQTTPTCDYRTDPECPAPGEGGHIPDNWSPGQEDIDNQPELSESSRWYVFALQSASGTVAVAETPKVKHNGESYNPGEIAVRDGDELVPGKNALSVGAQPVAIAGDPSGCFMMTANAGSCDLSVIDVDRIVQRSTLPLVRKLDVTTPAGTPILARPAAMIADVRDSEIGVACPAQPTGLIYIAYPSCHAVAVVDAATGVAQSSIRFDAAGTATVGDGNLACPIECGMRMPIADGGRPVTLDLVRDDVSANRRLAIGLDNRPVVTVVDLDAAYLPTTIEQYDLEGDVGVVDVAISKVINMTGDDGWMAPSDISPLRAAQYVYAVANDATVRVVETGTFDHECDVQADPRFVRDITDGRDFICFAPGQVGTPPRRAFARSPGIQLPGDDAPLSVVIGDVGANKPKSTVAPTTMIGYFGFVTSTLGLTYVINLDDDNYADTQNSADPLESQPTFAMPHQLRDGIASRSEEGPPSDPTMLDNPQCDYDGPFVDGQPIGGPRADADPTLSAVPSEIATVKLFAMPYLRNLHCQQDEKERAVPEVMYANTRDVRDQVFPDVRAIPFEETWRFYWEGSLSRDGVNDSIDGPATRSGQVTIGSGSISVHDAAHPYCAAGVQPFDYVQMRGCDPTQGDRQCGLGETCYVHPDATVSSGSCLPKDRVAQLASACRDFLVSVRRYAVQQATSGELVMSERKHVLRTTPITGCTSVAQCEELADYESTLTSGEHPKDDTDETAPPSTATWACEPDPTRAPGINRCVETCTMSSECAEGTVCSGGYCLEGTIPPAACVSGLQRYSIHASDAFVAIGSRTGFLHDVVEAPGGQCVRNPMANPLNVGRIPLNVPACTGNGFEDVTPNPCLTTVEHTEVAPNYLDTQTCRLPSETDIEPASVLRTVQLDAIRWKNPLMTLNIVNATYPGDAICKFDRGGGRVGIPAVFTGYNFEFHLVAGFKPQIAGSLMVLPSRIIRSPDGVLWIVDEGDSDPGSIDLPNDAANFRGQIMRIDPEGIASAVVIR
jgi:hypothetical protein